MVASHRRPERRAELQEKYGITVYADNREACEGADVIYPVVRPGQMGVTDGGDRSGDRGWADSRCGRCIAAPLLLPPVSVFQMHPRLGLPDVVYVTETGLPGHLPRTGSNPERIRDLESYWGRFCEHIITIREEAMDTFVLLHAAGQTFIWPVLKAFVEFGSANGFTMKESQAITLSTLESMARCLKTQDASPIGLEGMMEEYSVPASMTESGLAVLRRNYVESLYAQTLETGMTQARVNREGAIRASNHPNTA